MQEYEVVWSQVCHIKLRVYTFSCIYRNTVYLLLLQLGSLYAHYVCIFLLNFLYVIIYIKHSSVKFMYSIYRQQLYFCGINSVVPT
jgi:hypothetical protein